MACHPGKEAMTPALVMVKAMMTALAMVKTTVTALVMAKQGTGAAWATALLTVPCSTDSHRIENGIEDHCQPNE